MAATAEAQLELAIRRFDKHTHLWYSNTLSSLLAPSVGQK